MNSLEQAYIEILELLSEGGVTWATKDKIFFRLCQEQPHTVLHFLDELGIKTKNEEQHKQRILDSLQVMYDNGQNKIQMIKYVKQHMNWGLLESKNFVELHFDF